MMMRRMRGWAMMAWSLAGSEEEDEEEEPRGRTEGMG